MTITRIAILLVLLGSGLTTRPLAAAVIFDVLEFSEDFESYSVGSTLPASSSQWDNVTGTPLIIEDTSNLLGQGTANQMLQIDDTGAGQIGAEASGFSTGLTAARLSFDFYEPDNIGTRQLNVRLEDSSNRIAAQVRVQDGQLEGTPGTFAEDAAVHVDLFYNDTGATLEYFDPNGALQMLATGRSDVWLNGILAVNDHALQRAGAVLDVTTLQFTTLNADSQQIFVDNIQVHSASMAAVPEPGSLSLLGGVMCVGAIQQVRRRRRRTAA